MSRFDGKIGIITGAASGIGKEIALRFAAQGGVPVIADLNLDAAGATAREIKASGADAFAVAMDVADEAAVEKGVADMRLMHTEMVQSMRIRHAPLLDEPHSLKLELACKLPSLHDLPPVPSKHLTRCLRNRVQAKLAKKFLERLRETVELESRSELYSIIADYTQEFSLRGYRTIACEAAFAMHDCYRWWP